MMTFTLISIVSGVAFVCGMLFAYVSSGQAVISDDVVTTLDK